MSPLLRARPPFIAIALLSACTLAYEVALTRLFSIVLWHHFAYMIISAAMLGYGASGTALALLKEKIAPRFGTIYISAAAGMALFVLCSINYLQQLHFLMHPEHELHHFHTREQFLLLYAFEMW